MIIETLSTFPQMFDSVLGSSMMKRARDKGLLQFVAYDLRNWTHDVHRTTDDAPYGGGAGLVMKCEPIFEAYDTIVNGAPAPQVANSASPVPHFASNEQPFTIFLTPCGTRFNDALATELSHKERLLFICGHYEGIDERAYTLADAQLSLGDYVLTSGELASMVVIDAVVRKIGGVLGAEEGAADESFVDGLLEYPQYTRPSEYRGMAVPEVLLSGNHEAVAQFRREQSLLRTAQLRPDLLESAPLDSHDWDFLKSLKSVGSSSV